MLSTRTHSMMDYVIGIALLLAPNIFGFADVPAATWAARVCGLIILGQNLMTRWEMTAAKIIPVRMHLMMDYVIGALLAASPWLMGFNDNPSNVWMPHLIVGLAIILQAAITRRTARSYATDVTDDVRRAA